MRTPTPGGATTASAHAADAGALRRCNARVGLQVNRYTKYLREMGRSVADGSFALRRRHCNFCERRTWFLASGRESRSIRCLGCRATAISLSSLKCIQALPLEPARAAVYELSYHGPVFNWLRRRFADFHCSEYFAPQAGAVVNGVRNEDVQRLTWPDGRFDLVSSTEVFEHVPDYRRGFEEVHRVLRPGGWFVFTVPLFDAALTICLCRIAADGALQWLGVPEYHDSRVTGLASVPVFWHHSRVQIVRDLQDAGFRHAEVAQSQDFSATVPQHVVLAQR